MHAELEDWHNGWHGLRLSLHIEEIDRLLALLQELRQDPDQHFHISSDYSGVGGLGDIEVSVASGCESGNMRFSGLALSAGAALPALGA